MLQTSSKSWIPAKPYSWNILHLARLFHNSLSEPDLCVKRILSNLAWSKALLLILSYSNYLWQSIWSNNTHGIQERNKACEIHIFDLKKKKKRKSITLVMYTGSHAYTAFGSLSQETKWDAVIMHCSVVFCFFFFK